MEISPLESRFDTFQDYRQAVAAVVSLAQRKLSIFDPDLKETGLDSRTGTHNLIRLLTANRGNHLRIVVHRAERIERHSPLLIDLLRNYGHVAFLRQSPDDLRNLTDCFVIADGRHAAIRFHADHARGKLLIAQDDEVGNWQRRFDELWEVAIATSCTTTLGL